MSNKDLLRFCRYYRGEPKNPYEGRDQNKSAFWDYERFWVLEASKREPNFSEVLDNYIACGLNNFSFNDGVPMTLKALLFDRYAKTAISMREAAEHFKEFYVREYLSH